MAGANVWEFTVSTLNAPEPIDHMTATASLYPICYTNTFLPDLRQRSLRSMK